MKGLFFSEKLFNQMDNSNPQHPLPLNSEETQYEMQKVNGIWIERCWEQKST